MRRNDEKHISTDFKTQPTGDWVPRSPIAQRLSVLLMFVNARKKTFLVFCKLAIIFWKCNIFLEGRFELRAFGFLLLRFPENLIRFAALIDAWKKL